MWLSPLLVASSLHCGRPSWPGGIHALLRWSPAGVRVSQVPAGGPADEAGLRADDELVSVDGIPLAGLSGEQVQQLLTGEVGSKVMLGIRRAGEELQIAVERAPYEKHHR